MALNRPSTKVQMLNAMATATGLSKATIKDLMKHGWYYQELPGGKHSFVKK